MASLRDIFNKHPHFSTVNSVYHNLSSAGYMVYLAGGCVRDALLGLPIGDFDIATNATPEQVEGLFEKTIAVGKQFGIIMVPFNEGTTIEVASFRKDGLYVDGRRPESVTLATPEEDAQRRDFTINALFYDLKTDRVIDHVGGLQDLQKKYIRTVGNPQERFQEDHLRILRAFRFVGQLGFDLDAETQASALSLKEKVKDVSRERISDEFKKSLKGPWRERTFVMLRSGGFLQILLPRLPWSDKVDRELQKSLKAFPVGSTIENWLSFFVPIFLNHSEKLSLEDLKSTLKSLKFSSADEKLFIKAFEICQEKEDFQKRPLTYQYQILSESDLRKVFEMAVILDADAFSFWPQLSAQAKSRLGEEYILPEAWVTGEDLKKLGIAVGPQMGEILRKLYELQLSGTVKNKAEALKIQISDI